MRLNQRVPTRAPCKPILDKLPKGMPVCRYRMKKVRFKRKTAREKNSPGPFSIVEIIENSTFTCGNFSLLLLLPFRELVFPAFFELQPVEP